MLVGKFYFQGQTDPCLVLEVNNKGKRVVHGDDFWLDYSYKPFSYSLQRNVSFQEDSQAWLYALQSAYQYEQTDLRIEEVEDNNHINIFTNPLSQEGNKDDLENRNKSFISSLPKPLLVIIAVALVFIAWAYINTKNDYQGIEISQAPITAEGLSPNFDTEAANTREKILFIYLQEAKAILDSPQVLTSDSFLVQSGSQLSLLGKSVQTRCTSLQTDDEISSLLADSCARQGEFIVITNEGKICLDSVQGSIPDNASSKCIKKAYNSLAENANDSFEVDQKIAESLAEGTCFSKYKQVAELERDLAEAANQVSLLGGEFQVTQRDDVAELTAESQKVERLTGEIDTLKSQLVFSDYVTCEGNVLKELTSYQS